MIGKTPTPKQLKTLERLLRRGPLTLAEAKGAGRNMMPSIIQNGWARSSPDQIGYYTITDEGISALTQETAD